MSFLSRFRRNVIAFPLAALAALAMLAISEASYQDATSSLDTPRRARDRARQAERPGEVAARRRDRPARLPADRSQGVPAPLSTRQLTETRSLLAWLTSHYASDAKTAPVMREVARETEAKLSELATTIDLHDRGVENGWRELLLSDIGREKMEHVRTLGEQLINYETTQVASGRQQRLPDAAAEPHRRLGDGRGQPARALHVPAPDRDPRPHPGRRGGTRRRRARIASRPRSRREPSSCASSPSTCRRSARTSAAGSRASCTTSSAPCSPPPSSTSPASSRASARRSRADATERLAHLNEALNGGIALKRRIIEDLRPSSLSNLGLVAALEILLREFAARSEIKVVDDLEPASSSTPAAQLTVYRLVQEALTNVVKYAKAREVVVTLDADRRRRRAGRGASDNGVGFDTDLPRLAAPRPDRHALSRRGRGRDDAARRRVPAQAR